MGSESADLLPEDMGFCRSSTKNRLKRNVASGALESALLPEWAAVHARLDGINFPRKSSGKNLDHGGVCVLIAVVLAGGKGTRLLPRSEKCPKPLMPIGDTPILALILQQLERDGIREVVLALGHQSAAIKEYLSEGIEFSGHLHWQVEQKPLGTAGPLRLIDPPDESFVVINADVLTTLDFADLADFHRRQGSAVTVAAHKRRWRVESGVVEINGNHTIREIVEKPVHEYYENMGIYVCEPSVIDYLPANHYCDFPDLIEDLLSSGHRVAAYRFHGYWRDIGRPRDYAQAVKDFDKSPSRFLAGVTW